MATIIQGAVVRFNFTVLDITGALVDPDVAGFAFAVQGQNPNNWEYAHTTGDPTSTIIRVSTGTFYADIDTTSYTEGTWNVAVYSLATNLNLDSTRTQSRYESTIVVSPQSVPAP